MEEESELLKIKKEKIESLKAEGVDLYPNDVRVSVTSKDIIDRFGQLENEALEKIDEVFSVAGRIMALRDFGKASFVTIQDRKGRIQAYVRRDKVGEKDFAIFKRLEVGDIIWVSGRVFRTRTKELTIEAAGLKLLAKATQTFPEKWHGLTDTEIRYRQRYLDLIVNPKVKQVFETRSRIIQLIRQFMLDRDFLEVETPMMQPMPGGAMAKPFKTFHNALGMDFYLRIAPELYLKRLVVGGMERVFEINRNFRNEGMSTFHNPEFTMMEFYLAYATYEDLMDLTEELLVSLCKELFGTLSITYQGETLDFTPPFQRISVVDALVKYAGVDPGIIYDREKLLDFALESGVPVEKNESWGKILMAIFDEKVEQKLVMPTFVTQYPLAVSPLSRKNPADPVFTDRFELYISGKEIANAFSELNDPFDQRERFAIQLQEKETGDEEAHEMDEDFIRALEYGMPPTAGEGIGIDRLIMIFTDSASIRDVILFPHMRIRDAVK